MSEEALVVRNMVLIQNLFSLFEKHFLKLMSRIYYETNIFFFEIIILTTWPAYILR